MSALQVSVLSAGSTVQTCPTDTCFNDYMATATLQTKEQLTNFLHGIKSEQGKIKVKQICIAYDVSSHQISHTYYLQGSSGHGKPGKVMKCNFPIPCLEKSWKLMKMTKVKMTELSG